MNKKQCLNFLLSASTQDPISLSSLTPFIQIAQEFKLKPAVEISDLEKKAVNLEAENPGEAFTLWLKSINLKLANYKSFSDKIQKFILQFLEALCSQMVANINKKCISELLKILANLSKNTYKLPENERTRCKVRYYIFLSGVYLGKGKINETIECAQTALDNSKHPYDQICCLNLLSLCECRSANHAKALNFHMQGLDIVKSLSNPVYECVILYNLTIEYLHLEDFNTSKKIIKEAFEIAERNKNNRNLIFSKILLFYQELCGRDLKKEIKAPSSNTLKKKTLEFMFKGQEEKPVNKPREISLPRGRKNQANENTKTISLGSKFTRKKRSKTEHAGKSPAKKLKEEIVVKFKRDSAANTIQRAWKVFKSRKLKSMEKRYEFAFISNTCQDFQNLILGISRRLKFVFVKAKENYLKRVVLIQSHFKRSVYLARYQKLRTSAQKIQAFIKGFLLKKSYKNLKFCTVKIQSFFRSVLLRKQLKNLHKNAKKIQTWAKKIIKKLYVKKNGKFARFIRLYVLCLIKSLSVQIKPKTKPNKQKLTNKDILPIIKIQSLFRMFPLKFYYKILKKSTLCIQRFVRGYLDRKHLKIQQRSARKIQTFIKQKFNFRSEIYCY